MGYTDKDEVYSDFLNLVNIPTGITRTFQNNKFESELHIPIQSDKYTDNNLLYRILRNFKVSKKLPQVEIIAEDKSFCCNIKVNDRNIDINVDVSKYDAVVHYDSISTYIFRHKTSDKLQFDIYQIVSKWDNEIVILNLKDNICNRIDPEKGTCITFRIVYDKDNIFDEYQIRLSEYKNYKYTYDKFGNVDQVTKNSRVYSVRTVSYEPNRPSDYVIYTLSPLPMIFNNGIEFEDDYIYVEHTRCNVMSDKVTDILREVHKYTIKEYEEELATMLK